MNPQLFFVAAALGAVVLYLMTEPRPAPFRAALTISGLAAMALLITAVARNAPAPTEDAQGGPFWVHVLLALVAVTGAARMITHPKPVYAALYFILVILAVAGTLLLLQAEVMAFALLIVYAGAILITYLFVLMLASQSGDREARGEEAAWYDRTPRQPGMALVLSFVLLAATGDALFRRENAVPWNASPAVTAQASARAWRRMEDLPELLLVEARAVAQKDFPQAAKATFAAERGRRLAVAADGSSATVTLRGEDGTTHPVTLPATALPSNGQALGHALVASFPVSLELAGVILLMALFGAVVLARRQMQMAEAERRAAAGMQRLGDETLDRGGAA